MLNRLVLNAGALALLIAASAAPAAASTLYFDFNQNLVSPNASVFLFGAANQTATVSNLAGFNTVVNLGADGFENLFIPSTFQQSGTGIRNTGFTVASADPIAGYFINRAGASTDMTYLLDSAALDTAYVIASQGGGFGEGSQVAIHATQPNTVVTFTPKGGAPIVVTLNAGETYKYAGGATNLTGSTVVATKPVAVFAGHECAQVPDGATFCDTLLEQMIPTSHLSSDYLIAASKGANLSGSDLVRVVATAPGTVVTVNGVVVATLANIGDFYEFSLAANTGAHIETSAPAMIAQYLKGGGGSNTDPALSLVPGSDTWLASYRLATPTGSQQFVENYASIVLSTAALGSLTLNGVAVNTASFTPIAGTGFSRGNVNLPLGVFTLDASEKFLVMLGGGSGADSYYTYGGSTFAPGISPGEPPVAAVPEPATLLLLGSGLAGVVARRRKRAL
jgi:hypothetical protein